MSDVVAQVLNNPVIPAIGLSVAATFAALWLAAAWWTYRDATRRAGSSFIGLLAAAWIVVSSPFLLPFSLAVYTLARPQQTAAEGRSRRLAAELVDQLEAAAGTRCPGCRVSVDPTWLRCPTCSTWLAQPCARCGGWSERELDVCPWCGSEERNEPTVEMLQTDTAPAIPRKHRRRPGKREQAALERDPRQPRRRVEVLGERRSPARAG